MKLKNKTLMHKMSLALAPVALLMTVQAASAGELDALGAALGGGKTNFATQYRYESVDTPVHTKTMAKAQTLGTRLGYETGDFHDFAANVQVQGVWSNKQFDDNQANGNNNTGLNKVNDPGGVGVNSAHLIYRGIADTTLRQGRQIIRYDDDRWVGNVDWRQNWQTYDATSITNKSIADTTVQAAYVTNVNRPNTDGASANGNAHMKSTLVNVNNKSLSFADIVAYSYRLDYNTANQSLPTVMGSTNTSGVKLAKDGIDVAGFKLGWTGEMASQKNFKQNATNYTAKYTNIGASISGSLGKLTVAQETLGSDNGVGLQTPLATLFAFNGWADKFTVTPKNGLKDSYIRGRSTVAGIVVGADFHQFKSDAFSLNLGREVDLIAEKDLDKNFAVGARAARYKADTASVGTVTSTGINLVDTNKAWVYGTYKF